ncbi:MAG: hypothetical protein IVW54_05345 [Candidatus Binataceae bacterium]|nr:hypothetical protein [Candidatus Binataceae bacterium]
MPLTAGPQGQVVAHDIDKDGHQHQGYGDDQAPIMMRVFPVGAMKAMMNTVVIQTFVRVMPVLFLIH